MTACPSFIALGLMIISRSIPSVSITLFNAVLGSVRERGGMYAIGGLPLRLIQRLLVLKILNLRTANYSYG